MIPLTMYKDIMPYSISKYLFTMALSLLAKHTIKVTVILGPVMNIDIAVNVCVYFYFPKCLYK